jgi:thiol-disulfide isomerase/thioredoxin
MIRLILVAGLLFLGSVFSNNVFSNNVFAKSGAFSAEQFEKVRQQYKGQKWMVLMWSLDCPPCFKELAYVAKLKKQNPQLPVVLINADGDAQLSVEREALIAKYGLHGLINLHFVDGKASQGRFALDPSWYGELPRSYFYQADGTRKAKSGLVSEAALTDWLMPKRL